MEDIIKKLTKKDKKRIKYLGLYYWEERTEKELIGNMTEQEHIKVLRSFLIEEMRKIVSRYTVVDDNGLRKILMLVLKEYAKEIGA